MSQLLAENVTHFGERKLVYNGRNGFYTAGPLPLKSEDFIVTLIDLGSVREFKVTVKLSCKTEFNQREFLRGRHSKTPYDTIRLLNIVLRQSLLSKNHTVVGSSLFAPDCDKQTIGNGVECWKGFYQSVRSTQMGLSLNMNTSSTYFYEPISVIHFVARMLNIEVPKGDACKPLSFFDRTKVQKALEGVTVKVNYGVQRSYKIIGLTPLRTNQLTFHTEDEAEKSVVQYFRDKYNKRLRFCDWPALLSGNKSREIFLPMECCTIVKGQRYSKELNNEQITALLRMASKSPNEHEADIKKIAEDNNYGIDDLAKEFGVSVKKELTFIESRQLPAPMLKYHDSGVEKTKMPQDGRWNMNNAKLLDGATVNSWTCVNFSSLDGQQVTGFCGALVNKCRDMGMVISPTPVLATQSCSPNAIEKTLAGIHRMCIAEGKPLQLLIVVLPDRTGSYGIIKRVCETELGIVSQCCQPKYATKWIQGYLVNVALKINVKAGGSNVALDDEKVPLLSDSVTIIFGADVTHPNPGDISSPSISAVVASMDWPSVTKYRVTVSAQQHRHEIIHDCYAMVREQLEAFMKENHELPRRIIFYRDGVGERQFRQVLSHEVKAIREACKSVGVDYQPCIIYVVVQKRHHTRFFPTESSQSINVLPGTVVDTAICHPSEFDFYLCSHAGIQETSRPAHYHVLCDDGRSTADDLQILTNNLCYIYAKCTHSVSIVTPVYYAHLAAFRARYYMEGYEEGGGGGVPGMRMEASPVRQLPAIKENVKNVMFFC